MPGAKIEGDLEGEEGERPEKEGGGEVDLVEYLASLGSTNKYLYCAGNFLFLYAFGQSDVKVSKLYEFYFDCLRAFCLLCSTSLVLSEGLTVI